MKKYLLILLFIPLMSIGQPPPPPPTAKVVENDEYQIITKKRYSTVLDEELTKRYGGVKTYKDIVITETLGYFYPKGLTDNNWGIIFIFSN